MKKNLIDRLGYAFSCLVLLLCLMAARAGDNGMIGQQPIAEKGLFDADELLDITLKGNLREVVNDRTDIPKNFSLVLSYQSTDSGEITMPVQVRTRGHFRRMKENCSYPPLLIQFAADGPHLNTIFREQRKLKLVMPCKEDFYIIREWLVYKLYNLVTPKSFRARLVKVKLEDARSKKQVNSFYGILLEEEKQMAKRNQAKTIEMKLQPTQTQRDAFLTMTVFEYLIGNTDWSVQYLPNIKLLQPDSSGAPVTVPYDYDHAGIVNTPYALPAEELELRSVRERRYRGYCEPDLKVFEPVIAKYNNLKKEIYHVYESCTLLDEKYRSASIKYLDEFYTTINNPKAWQKEFAYPCEKNGTGNVVIKGLKAD